MPMIGTIGNPVIADTTRELSSPATCEECCAHIKFKEGSEIMNDFSGKCCLRQICESRFDGGEWIIAKIHSATVYTVTPCQSHYRHWTYNES